MSSNLPCAQYHSWLIFFQRQLEWQLAQSRVSAAALIAEEHGRQEESGAEMSHCVGPADPPQVCNDWLKLCHCRYKCNISHTRAHTSRASVWRGESHRRILRSKLATCVIKRSSYITHVTPVLPRLGWLPMEKHIIDKKFLLLSKAISLTELRRINAPTRSLRTFSSMQLILPPAHLVTMGSRAFSRSAPPLLEFSASWHPTLHFHYHFQISLENTSIQAST